MAPDTGPTGLSDLPPELVGRIIDFDHPSAHLDFACTCRFLAACSKDVLKAHGQAHEDYEVCADVLPSAIPSLIRTALVDPITAWHVRSLEFYTVRCVWADWQQAYRFEIEKASNCHGKGRPRSYTFDQDERTRCLELLRELCHFSEADIDRARDDLERGNDGPLKMVLLALCPRLKSLKHSRDFYVSGCRAFEDEAFVHVTSRSSLDYIQRTILCCAQDPGRPWPLGLLSLRELAVGVETGTEIDEIRPRVPPHLLLDLMKLPNLSLVYVRGVDGGHREIGHRIDFDDDEDVSIPYDLAEKSSSVQHIFLEHTSDVTWKFRDALIAAPKRLVSMFLSDGETSDIDNWINQATKCHRGSLENFMLYKSRELRGYRYTLFLPHEWGMNLSGLKTFVIDYEDFFWSDWQYRKNRTSPCSLTKSQKAYR